MSIAWIVMSYPPQPRLRTSCAARPACIDAIPQVPASTCSTGWATGPLGAAGLPLNRQVFRSEVKMFEVTVRTRQHRTFFQRHGLTIVTSSILLLWIVLYSVSDEKHHIGS